MLSQSDARVIVLDAVVLRRLRRVAAWAASSPDVLYGGSAVWAGLMGVRRSGECEPPGSCLAAGCCGGGVEYDGESNVCAIRTKCSTGSGGGHQYMLWLVNIRSLMLLLYVRVIGRCGQITCNYGGTSLVAAPAGRG